MRVFVSYARRDNDETALRRIERQVRSLFPGSTPYIDDLHHGTHNDRHEDVKRAFNESAVFVAIMSPWYRQTHWTEKEFQWAVKKGIPMYEIQKHDLTALAA